jgi:hypothetical protein
MFYDTGCYGRVLLGSLSAETAGHLAALPGEWLEFDAEEGAIVVRHIQPTAGPSLPTIAGELVAILAGVPAAQQAQIKGGDLFVHTEKSAQLVRLRVEPGGALHVRWAHPDYAKARRQAYVRGAERLVDPRIQRLDGTVRFTAPDPGRAAADLDAAADTFDGLYPEGECRVTTGSGGSVQADLAGVNLDVDLLMKALERIASPGSLIGQVDVSSFAGEAPERYARFVFESGRISIQRPVLWQSDT